MTAKTGPQKNIRRVSWWHLTPRFLGVVVAPNLRFYTRTVLLARSISRQAAAARGACALPALARPSYPEGSPLNAKREPPVGSELTPFSVCPRALSPMGGWKGRSGYLQE